VLCAANFKNEFVFEFQKVTCNQISKIESLFKLLGEMQKLEVIVLTITLT